MKRLLFVGLLIAVTACRKPAPPQPPTPAALGAELATFQQVLAPLAPQTVKDYNDAIRRKGLENVTTASFVQRYVHGSATVNGKEVGLYLAFISPWQAPTDAYFQPMSPLQYLRAFAADTQTDLGMLVTAKGNMFIARAHLPEVLSAAKAAGASDADMPFVLIRGTKQ